MAARAATQAEALKAKLKAKEDAFPSATVESLQSAVDAVTRNGKVALLLAVGPAYIAAQAELLTWDGRGLTAEEWAAEHDAILARQRVEIAEQSAEHAAEQQRRIDEWREARSKAQVDAGQCSRFAADDDNESVPEELLEPFVPREPEWDGTFLLDTAPFVLPFAKTRVRVDDHVEMCRRKLVRCMKAGGTAVVDIGSLAPDFVNKVRLFGTPCLCTTLSHNPLPRLLVPQRTDSHSYSITTTTTTTGCQPTRSALQDSKGRFLLRCLIHRFIARAPTGASLSAQKETVRPLSRKDSELLCWRNSNGKTTISSCARALGNFGTT